MRLCLPDGCRRSRFPRGQQLTNAFNSLVAFYRRFNPMPKSPQAAQGQDPSALTLVPAEALRRRIVRSVRLLESLGERVRQYVEFGVYNGTSFISVYRGFTAAGIEDFHLAGFDSFQGLPETAALEDGGVWEVGQFQCPQSTTVDRLRAAGVPERCYTLVPGWFAATLVDDNRRLVPAPVSIVMIDCDTYGAARLALRFVGPLLCRHAVVFFDDWRLNDLDLRDMGEKRAFAEFMGENPDIRATRIRSYNRKSNAFLLSRRRHERRPDER